ncbi:winged helix-turn-helix domain-containing protein [Yinghuangia sp. ASG 101]|uniref:ArsR/SmtB family transcription factor n=1 Tax=Yinghuangia sp. ASG 101 TaxID=2896848 RepID=UPI001E57AFBF|nr:winged helix-turn-helix domain-containing protein [Yinghuangia sp. ASG 101]UGQ11622.1 winged helix-turn-helix domain-containing protein [Yinghuangia sp. ASG 101]
MGLWLLDVDTLARGRFVISPLAETVASLLDLERPTACHPAQATWIAAHLPAYRERLARNPVAAAVVRAGFRPTWIADYLVPAPSGDDTPDVDEELRRVRATPPATARADLATALGGGPLPDVLRRDDVPAHSAALLRWVWTRAVLPDWDRRRRVLEADVVARTRQLSDGGWAAALDGLHPHSHWLGDGRLQVNTHDNPPRSLHGAHLLFVPVTRHSGWVAGAQSDRYALVYPCTGALAGHADRPAHRALHALLGPRRARILTLLGTPKSTTHLVALTGSALGSVGGHLKVLLDAGLVRRGRAGRSVLYYRSDTGDALVEAAHHGRTDGGSVGSGAV